MRLEGRMAEYIFELLSTKGLEPLFLGGDWLRVHRKDEWGI